MSIAWHYVLKFIITGDAAVGKSSLLIRLTDQRFLANPDPTLGVEFGTKLITIPEEEKVVKLQCWDTAGTESFRAITRSYYRGAAGCLLVYDVTSRKSFLNCQNWLKDVREHADPNLTCILVGNKVDLCEGTANASADAPATGRTSIDRESRSGTLSASPRKAAGAGSIRSTRNVKQRTREVPTDEAEKWAKEEGLLFVEASAKSGLNVELAFVEACKDILKKINKGAFDDDRSPGVKLSQPHSAQVKLDQKPAAAGSCC